VASLCRFEEMLDEFRFADARLASEEDNLSLAGRKRIAQPEIKVLELGTAADERSGGVWEAAALAVDADMDSAPVKR
jgi:hypothetical protein